MKPQYHTPISQAWVKQDNFHLRGEALRVGIKILHESFKNIIECYKTLYHIIQKVRYYAIFLYGQKP